MTLAVRSIAAACVVAVLAVAPARGVAQIATPPDDTATPSVDPEADTPPVPDTALLMGLDKITARTHPMAAAIGEELRFGRLGITVRACEKARPEDPPRTIAFLEIRDYSEDDAQAGEPNKIFVGWMLASSPGLNALEHPVYDVWLIDCSTSFTQASAGNE